MSSFRKWSVVIILACAQFIMVLDSTVMNVSISEVVKDLGTTVSGLQAAITFYTLTMAALMMTGGKLGDKWGRSRTFRIGSVVYGVGSLITALSPNLAVLLVGWSLIEGMGAALVIPAIAALVAMNYVGRDRVVGYTLLGAASGIAVAAGPLIGGYVTTYFSWRYVFASESVVMVLVLIAYGLIKKAQSQQPATNKRLDILSVLLSASGMGLLVLGILQSKSWGWVIPKVVPQIGNLNLDPFGISLVTYLILAGSLLLKLFVNRQRALEKAGASPLLSVEMFSIKPLRAGLGVLGAQYLITASIFFVMPIYLQMVLGYDALQTGKKIFPLSIAIVGFSAIGSRLVSRYSPKRLVRVGQLALVGGSLLILTAIDPQISGWLFALGLLVLGAGLGLLASQVGNVTMSSAPTAKSSEVGGLQGTFQNLGSSFGTALIGSVMIAFLTANFKHNISQNTALPQGTRTAIQQQTSGAPLPIVPAPQVEQLATANGLDEAEAQEISDTYQQAQIKGLRAAMLLVAVLGLLTVSLSRYIPNQKLG